MSGPGFISLEEARRRANEAPYEPGAEEPTPPLVSATPYRFADPATIPKREWLYGWHLVRRFVSMTIAPGAVGKSSLLIVEALAMTSGKPLLGISVHGGPKRVWLWNLEDPLEEIERRVAAAIQWYGLTPDDIGDRLYLDSGRLQPLCIAKQDNQGARIIEPVAGAIESELIARRIDVLAVDPFVSCHQVNENDNGAMDLVAKRWATVADRANCAIELAAHMRKLNGLEGNTDSARGAKAATDASRSTRILNKMTTGEAEKAGLDEPAGKFRIGHDKENLAPPSDKCTWCALEPVDLVNGDNVGVVVPWKWPDAFDGISVEDLFRVQKAVQDKNLRISPRAKNWIGTAVGEVLDLDVTDKANRAQIMTLVKTWIETGALREEEVVDDHRIKRACVNVGKLAQ